jgi:integrase
MSEKGRLAERRRGFVRELKQWVQVNCPNWVDEPPIKDWLSGLPSDRTRKNALRDFIYFLGFVKMCPTKIYELRVQDSSSSDPKTRTRFEHLVIEFKNAFTEHDYKEESILSVTNRVLSFFKHNYIPLSFPKGALKVEVTDTVKAGWRAKIPPTNLDVRAMYQVATPEERAMLLFGYQLGLLPADISRLTVEQIPVDENTSPDDFIYFEIPREKTNVPIRTALNPELIHDYKTLLRLKGYPKSGYVFEAREYSSKKRMVNERTGRIREDNISQTIKDLAFKGLEKEKAERFKFKDLRDAFNQALLEVQISQEFKDSFMGHKRDGARSSYPMSDNAAVETYRRVFPLLSINHIRQRRADTDELKDLVKNLIRIQLSPNPFLETVKLVEKLQGLKPNELRSALEQGRMTREQLMESMGDMGNLLPD